MRRLLCLVALALVLHAAAAQSFVATAATTKVQQRVSEILQAGGRLTPESLLQKSSTVSAAAYSGPAHDAASKRVQIAGTSIASDEDMDDADAELEAVNEDGSVRVAAKDVHIKWAVRQEGEMTLQPEDDKSESAGSNMNESAELLRRYGSKMQQRPALETEVEFVKVTPGTEEHMQNSRELSERQQDSDKATNAEDAPKTSQQQQNRGSEDSLQGITAKDAELLQRLTNVDWKAVLEAAAKDAEAEERAAAAKKSAVTEARNAELKRRMELAAAAKLQTEKERLYLTAERKEALQAITKATGELQLAEDLKRKAAEVRQQIDAAREMRAMRDTDSYSSSKPAGKGQPTYGQHSHQTYEQRSHDSYKRQEKEGYDADATYPGSDGYDSEDDYPNRVKVIVLEKNRSQPRYFPGGGMYSFTSELTCTTDEEAKAKLSHRAFPLLTPRMAKTTVGVCEWTVAETNPTKVNKNVFLLGNGWATCTFLPLANKVCAKPISGGLTLTIQALMYQFAQPQSIREPDVDDEAPEAAVKTADAKKATDAGSASVSIASVNLMRRPPRANAAIASAAKHAAIVAKVAPAAKSANGTAAPRTAAAAAMDKIDAKSSYLVDVELQNVFLGLITGAHGPKKSHKYKSGALQYIFGPPPETDGKAYAVETQMLPPAYGEPSVDQLQEGMVQLVPGTYQFAFDEE